MYGNNSIQDPYFMLLYGLTMMLALGTAVYLLCGAAMPLPATKQSLP